MENIKIELKKYVKDYHPDGYFTYEIVVNGKIEHETMNYQEAIYLFDRTCQYYTMENQKITIKSVEL